MDTPTQAALVPEQGDTMITTLLKTEHRILRVLMEAMAEWLSKAPDFVLDEMRGRTALLYVALEDHAQREERHLFTHLRPLSDRAQHLVDMMILVHDEVRDLFDAMGTLENPKGHIWTILDLTETHFGREENEVFPLAETLMPKELLVELAQRG